MTRWLQRSLISLMLRQHFVLIAITFSALHAASGVEPMPPSKRIGATQDAMEKAARFMRSISTEGGYVYLYAPDLSKRTAERPATVTQIAIQPPGTPAMGMAFLHAYEITRSAVHLEAARGAAAALARCQLGSGGWHSTADFDPARPNVDGKLYGGEKYKFGQIIKHTLGTTFDDDTTQSAVRFLLEYCRATKGSVDAADAEIQRSLERALTGMLRAQYPNGAWPQMYRGEARDAKDYPVKQASIPPNCPRTWPDVDYTGYYTLNDNGHSTCIKTMLLAHQITGKAEYLASARRGADFLLLAQLPEPQPAWAQQYNREMEPAWARVHECPSVCSAESGSVIQALLDIYLETGDRKYLDAAVRGVAWLERSKVGKNRWARLYELGTNRPVYGDERGQFVFDKSDLSPKYAKDYVWESKFRIPEVIARFEQVRDLGRDAALAAAQQPRKSLPELETHVDKVLAALDDQGRWITKQRWKKGAPPEAVISTKTFVANLETLAEYVKRASP